MSPATKDPFALTEEQWQLQVIGLARFYGWRVAHFRPARVGGKGRERWVTPVAADGKGFPDLVLAKAGLPLTFAELKTDTGRLSAEQRIWLEVLGAVPGIEAHVWRPRDRADVEAALKRRPLAPTTDPTRRTP